MRQPYRTLLLSLLISLSLACLAQERLAPGATWRFTNQGLIGTTYVRGTMTYDGDEVIQGEYAQRLLITESGYWPDQPYAYTNSGHYYFSTTGGLVKQLTSVGWDTLYRFDASLGDHWYAPGMGPGGFTTPCDPLDNRHTVIDTGHVTVSGVQLRQITLLSYRQEAPLVPIFRTITERIHFPFTTLYNTCNEIICTYSVPCSYFDPEIGDVPLGWTYPGDPCSIAWTELPTSIADPDAKPSVQLTALPGHLRITTKPGAQRPFTVTLFDTAGRRVLESTVSGDNEVLPHALPGGTYIARFGFADGSPSQIIRTFIAAH